MPRPRQRGRQRVRARYPLAPPNDHPVAFSSNSGGEKEGGLMEKKKRKPALWVTGRIKLNSPRCLPLCPNAPPTAGRRGSNSGQARRDPLSLGLPCTEATRQWRSGLVVKGTPVALKRLISGVEVSAASYYARSFIADSFTCSRQLLPFVLVPSYDARRNACASFLLCFRDCVRF